MFLFKGAGIFLFSGACMFFGLFLIYVMSRKKKNYGMDSLYTRVGNSFATLGFVLGFQFRMTEFAAEQSRNLDSGLPQPSLILLMYVLYLLIFWYITVFKEYKVSAEKGEVSKDFGKNTRYLLVIVTALVTLEIFFQFFHFYKA